MQIIKNPALPDWPELCQRPQITQDTLEERVRSILLAVKAEGDAALLRFARELDSATLEKLAVSAAEITAAASQLPAELKAAIAVAHENISRFHATQKITEPVIETTPGVQCWRRSVAIDRVGLYIPGGSAPLFSTVLMLGIPAALAGCQEIVLCSPPDANGQIHPAILYTAQLVGITQLFKIGGAQAIAAMACGTATVPKVDKIFGPGNQYVTKAKELVQQSGVAIDMPAGPSEVLVIADAQCRPEFVAADLLSQAEHGADSQVMLVSDNAAVITAVIEAVQTQLAALPRRAAATAALFNSKAILLENIKKCLDFSNFYAPEHLILAVKQAEKWVEKVQNAGSVFLGNYSCESAGDYASGTNHTLPTNGYARSYSGVSLDSFVKKITFQQITRAGIQNLGPAIEIMAEAEGLLAHKNAVSLRLQDGI